MIDGTGPSTTSSRTSYRIGRDGSEDATGETAMGSATPYGFGAKRGSS